MLISHSKKFIFIHNYKVAGTSIRYALRKYEFYSRSNANLLNKALLSLNIYPKIFSSEFSGHIKASELKKLLPISVFETYFKFGFVRNPWDWQVSLYTFILKDKTHFQHELIKNMKNFDDYIEWRAENFELQKDFFYDKNNVCLVDFIGKLRNIDKDFKYISDKLGISGHLPHLRKSRYDNNFLKYYNRNTSNIVAEVFKEDIETFGYDIPDI